MKNLHWQQPQILHKDFKATNVLAQGTTERLTLNNKGNGKFHFGNSPNKKGKYSVMVVDYERLMGLVRTSYSRAPEVLQQDKHRIQRSKMLFTYKCDVYSYNIICYEIVTNHVPFEGTENHNSERQRRHCK